MAPKTDMETSFVLFHGVHPKYTHTHTHITLIGADRSHAHLLKKSRPESNEDESNCLKNKKKMR